mmetsp:Transcript_8942/g.16215  ORF Transcript_8942/g.16215 Transcript_8942/m.16215 type:complete len:306 (-) Transcript_8942:1168-2085(-)
MRILYGLVALASIANSFTPSSTRCIMKSRSDETALSVQSSGSHNANRRFFLSTAAAIGGLLSANEARADFPNPFSGKKKVVSPTQKPRVGGGMASKIRKVGTVMDELQRDLMQERWDLVEKYPQQLRSFVPVFTTFTDAAFPTDIPTDKGLRVALRYEVGRFFACVERLRQATVRRDLDAAYLAYADMSLHFDRYLHVGGLYTYYDDTVSLEPYFKGFDDSALVYSDPKKDPAEVRDLIVMAKGPDKGKTGIVIGIYPDGSKTCVVKFDRYKEMREIKVCPREWVAKRLGEQDPDEAFLIPRKGG